MKNKTIFTILRCVIIIIAMYFFLILSPWILLWLGLTLMPKPPKPTICYGEFPFTLVYELNGEEKVIEDVAVCEFDGYDELTEAGQNREWRTYLKSEEDNLNSAGEKYTMGVRQIPLLDLRNSDAADDEGNKILELYFYGGNGHYYMGDPLGHKGRPPQDFERIYYMYQNENGELRYSEMSSEEALEEYHIRLISWEIEPPIENSFKTVFEKLGDKLLPDFIWENQ